MPFEVISYTAYGITAIAAVVIAFVIARSNTIKTTNEINKANIEALQTQNNIQAKEILDIQKSKENLDIQVSVLVGKVDTLSKIPLDKIEKHMADTNRILQSVLPLISQTTTEHTTTNTTRVTE